MSEYRCEHCMYNTDILDKIKNEMPTDTLVGELSDVFKVFGDGTRIRILWAIFDKELCVYDLSQAVGMTQSAVSHQLRVLKQARLVKARRVGKNIFYSLDDEHVKRIIEQVLIHISE